MYFRSRLAAHASSAPLVVFAVDTSARKETLLAPAIEFYPIWNIEFVEPHLGTNLGTKRDDVKNIPLISPARFFFHAPTLTGS